MVLICISLVTNGVEHLSAFLLATEIATSVNGFANHLLGISGCNDHIPVYDSPLCSLNGVLC